MAPAAIVVADAHKTGRHAASREQHNSAISPLFITALLVVLSRSRDSVMAEEKLLNLTVSEGNLSDVADQGNVTCSDQVSL